MRKSRLSQYKQNKLIELFVAGVTTRTASDLVNVNPKNTAACYLHCLRLFIYQHSLHLEVLEGEIEADESYFGSHRKSKCGVVQLVKLRYSGF